MKGFVKGFFMDTAGAVCYAAGIYSFARMANFAPGGLSGLAIIINYLWSLPIGIITLILNIPFVIFSYKLVGKTFLLKTARTMIICTLFLDVIFPHIPVYNGSPLLAALYSGVLIGVGLAVFYMNGSSSGGTDFLIMSVKALHPHLSIGVVTMTIDLIIILLGGGVFRNIDSVLYGLIAAFATSVTVDKIMYGIGSGKLVLIITERGQETAEKIGETCERGSTKIKARGTYTKKEKQVLLCACTRAEAYKIRSAVHTVDEKAFVMIAETSEVFGEGFAALEER